MFLKKSCFQQNTPHFVWIWMIWTLRKSRLVVHEHKKFIFGVLSIHKHHLPQIHFTVRILGRIKKQSLQKKTCQISVCLLKISALKIQDSLIWGADNWFIFHFEEFVDIMLLQSIQKMSDLDLFLNVKCHSSWWGSPLALTRWQYDPKGSSSLAQ